MTVHQHAQRTIVKIYPLIDNVKTRSLLKLRFQSNFASSLSWLHRPRGKQCVSPRPFQLSNASQHTLLFSHEFKRKWIQSTSVTPDNNLLRNTDLYFIGIIVLGDFPHDNVCSILESWYNWVFHMIICVYFYPACPEM